jgi:hypothetical protein
MLIAIGLGVYWVVNKAVDVLPDVGGAIAGGAKAVGDAIVGGGEELGEGTGDFLSGFSGGDYKSLADQAQELAFELDIPAGTYTAFTGADGINYLRSGEPSAVGTRGGDYFFELDAPNPSLAYQVGGTVETIATGDFILDPILGPVIDPLVDPINKGIDATIGFFKGLF